jgi:hypothetical protein
MLTDERVHSLTRSLLRNATSIKAKFFDVSVDKVSMVTDESVTANL